MNASVYGAPARRVPAPAPAGRVDGLGRLTRTLLIAGMVVAGVGSAAEAGFFGHGGMVRAVAVSPDGRKVLTGSFDYSAKLWDFGEQTEIATFDAHDGPVNAVAFLPDGHRALTASDDGSAIVWDIDSLAPVERLDGHQGKVMALAVSRDGALAATGAWDRTLKLWSLAGGEEIRTIRQPSNVNAAAFGADGTTVLTGGHDGVLRVWNVETGALVTEAKGHDWGITRIAVSPDGRRALSSGTDATLRLWALDDLSRIRVMRGHDGPIFGVAFAPDGRTALSAGRDGYVIHWDLATGKIIRSIQAHEAPVWSVSFTPDGRFAVSASSDERVRVWHLATGDQIGLEDEGIDEPRPWLESSHPGAKLFRKCARCHSLNPDGRRRSGPHFAGLYGRRVGSVAGYNYSGALRDRQFVWDEKTLYALFHDGPDVFLPGTKMPLQRIPDDTQLAQLIDYLREITALAGGAGASPDD